MFACLEKSMGADPEIFSCTQHFVYYYCLYIINEQAIFMNTISITNEQITSTKMNTEYELLTKTIAALHNETGIKLDIIQKNDQFVDIQVDAVIQFPKPGPALVVEFKKWAQQANLGALAERIKRLPIDGVLVADYINPNMAKKLKEMHVQFMDTAGNTYINQPPIYIQVTGNKQDQTFTHYKETNRAFDTTGLKVVFGFLCKPLLVNTTYREIAKATSVALGTVGWVINGLKGAGFVIERGKKRELINKRKLLDRWVEAYPEKLKPKQHVGEFIADHANWREDINIRKYGAFWGGEVAAAKYTNYLQPQIATVYLPKEAGNKLLTKAKLRKANEFEAGEAGVVRIFRPFWPIDTIQENNNEDLVHPILVYADLIETGDARNIETARMIYEQHINKYIGTDKL